MQNTCTAVTIKRGKVEHALIKVVGYTKTNFKVICVLRLCCIFRTVRPYIFMLRL